MRSFKTLSTLLVFLLSSTAHALTGDDRVPGASCAVNKSMVMTANPSGIGGYIMSCEAGKWRATITAENPTHDQHVATKKYVDDTLADSIATIDTHTYTNIQRRVDTTGELLPLLITGIGSADWGNIASRLCSALSGGKYVQGKILPAQRRHIHHGHTTEAGVNYRCENECITGPSTRYAFAHAGDFFREVFYNNSPPGSSGMPNNMGEATIYNCGTWSTPSGGPFTLNDECMAGATSSRASNSGRWPAYVGGSHHIQDITCWSN